MKLAELLAILDPALAQRIAQGAYEEVAAVLADRGEHLHAAVLWETTWDFEGACAAYLRANALLDALRCALSSGNATLADDAIAAITAGPVATRREAESLLRQRGQSGLLASLLSAPDADPAARSEALAGAGDLLGAAKSLTDAGRYDEALHRLRPLDHERSPLAHLELAASLHWKLGDAERAARLAQEALRRGASKSLNSHVLAPSLVALGHGLAADIARRRDPQDDGATPATSAPQRGRYLVQGVAPHPFVGRALLAVDTIEHREVEIHDLLSENGQTIHDSAEAVEVVRGFIETALAASELRHPAFRPVLWGDASAGMLILERGSTTTLRSLIRPPGLLQDLLRVKSMMLFMVRGLAAAHDRGLVHGALFPSLIVFDPAERPLLSPFGLHRLSGIVATRTGSLDELLSLTAPEVKAGGTPTPASDVFSLGRILAALCLGHIAEEMSALPDEIGALVTGMTLEDPAARPSTRQVLAQLASASNSTRRVIVSPRPTPSLGVPAMATPSEVSPPSPLPHVVAFAHESWSDDELEMLCSENHGFMQPILDRQARRFIIAAWPEQCAHIHATPDLDGAAARTFFEALEQLPDPLIFALRTRMAHPSIVQTPAGDWMLALDKLLCRGPEEPRKAAKVRS